MSSRQIAKDIFLAAFIAVALVAAVVTSTIIDVGCPFDKNITVGGMLLAGCAR